MTNFFQNLWDYFNGNIADRPGEAGDQYKQAYIQSNNALQNQKNLNSQYTGNAGFNNAINQGLQGAAVTAGQAGQQATQAARNAGMTKGRAANLGATQAANAYGQNFANQQNLAAGMGNAAIGANQALANQYLQNAGLAQSEAQRRYGNAANSLQTGINAATTLGNGLINLTALSDERMKNITDNVDHISKLAEDIGTYYYTYKNPEYPGADDKEHFGPVAQELEQNPITKDAVEEDENGIKHVNGERLALSEMAIISDLARRLADLEEENK
jgi:hypothetical protein